MMFDVVRQTTEGGTKMSRKGDPGMPRHKLASETGAIGTSARKSNEY